MKKKKEAAELEGTDLKAELKKAVLDMEQLLREKVYRGECTPMSRPFQRQFFYMDREANLISL